MISPPHRRYKFRGASGKVNLALGELPRFTCMPQPGPHLRGGSPSAERRLSRARLRAPVRRDLAAALHGHHHSSMLDPSMAPLGQHVMSIFVQYAPTTSTRLSDARREQFGDTVIDTLAQYART